MNPAESFSQCTDPLASLHGQPANEIELMAIDDVIEQGDVALLKSQLEAAHRLLGYQQNVVNSLTEQIQLKETHLLHAERQLDDLQQDCQSQTVELVEMRAICADLRSQLKRQTRRQASVQQSPRPQSSKRLGFEVQVPPPKRAAISFGYESTVSVAQDNHALTKAPPVQAWSAPQQMGMQEEVTFCQKLTTFIVSSATCVTTVETNSIIDVPAQTIAHKTESPKPSPQRHSPRHSVELPRFATR